MTQQSETEKLRQEVQDAWTCRNMDSINLWKDGDPLPTPTGDATRNDFIRMAKENNRLVLELQKLRAAVPDSSAEPVLKDEAIKTLVSHATDTGPLGKFARQTIFQDGLPRPEVIRSFGTSATRSSDAGRYDPEGFLSPIVIERYSEYMNRNRVQPDGSTRASDNWQAGFPIDQYMKGAWRHFLHLWTRHRGYQVMDDKAAKDIEDDLCALLFNLSGYLHELLKEKRK